MEVASAVLAAVLAQAAPSESAATADGTGLLRLERGADGAPVVVGAGDAPVRGADIYRAVLRLDLVDAYERKATFRRATWVFAAVALVAGPGLGYVVGKAAEQPTSNCSTSVDGVLIPECRPSAAIAAENDRRVRRDVLVGAAIGAGISAAFAVAARSIRPHEPSYEEARELVDAWNARNAAPRAGAAVGPSLALAPLPGGGAVSLALRW